MKKSSVSPGRTRLRSRSRTPCLSGNSGIAAPLSTMGASSRQAITRHPAPQLVEKGRVRLRGMLRHVRHALDLHGVNFAARLQRSMHESQVHARENIADVVGGHPDGVGRAQPAAVQFVANLQ